MRKQDNGRQQRCGKWPQRVAQIILPILFGLLLCAGVSAPSAAASEATSALPESCAGPVAGRHIYDCARVLTPSEVADLETQAAAVERAGAPTVVYLQVRNATAQQTLQDAIDLMNRWTVESRPGAHDGFVMVFDLQPGNLRHGTVALYAGEKHYQHGNLPQAELDRVRTDVMTPLLQDGQTAAGIAAGLQMVAHDLRYGPPPPPAYRTVSATLGRLPFNLFALVLAAVVAWLVVCLNRLAPMGSAESTSVLQSIASPGDLPPAMAGALIKGRITDAQVEATVLDFARRGLLIIEPTGENKVRMQLVGDEAGVKGLTTYEQEVWNGLTTHAEGVQRVLSAHQIADLRTGWGEAKTELRRALVERGWYDPERAASRRKPLYLTGVLGLIGAAVGIVLVILSQEGWAALGVSILLAAGVLAFVRGYLVPDTTVDGELAAAPWRGYRESVAAQNYEPNLDADLPYIVALGLLGRLTPRLKAASEHGYAPSWFRSYALEREDRRAPALGFYPYWIAFHTSMAPAASSSGSASGGYSGGGAAGGGGGSAGHF